MKSFQHELLKKKVVYFSIEHRSLCIFCGEVAVRSGLVYAIGEANIFLTVKILGFHKTIPQSVVMTNKIYFAKKCS